MLVEETHIKGCFVITPNYFEDDRGYFMETFNKLEFKKKTGLDIEFVQDNQSKSAKGVLRGLHFQKNEFAQAKLVRVLNGSVLDLCVDLRRNSKTFGEHLSIVLDDKLHRQLFIPRGMAHGFVALEEETILSYKCDNYYQKSSEAGIRFDDPTLNIDWKLPVEDLKLSEKDENLPTFSSYLTHGN